MIFKNIKCFFCLFGLLNYFIHPFQAFAESTQVSEMKESQIVLHELGFPVGTIDGLYGQKTERALKHFYKSIGKVFDGHFDSEEMDELLKATFLVSKSKYIKGVSKEQWRVIEKLGDPLNCEESIYALDSVKDGALVTLSEFEANKSILQYNISKNEVTILGPGVYEIEKMLYIPTGKTLIGKDGAIIDGFKVDTAIGNGGRIKNISVKNAQKYGIKLLSNSVTYKAIIKYTGLHHLNNFDGTGILSAHTVDSHGNCVVSVESAYGYNHIGNACCTKGGNADGVSVKYGAHNVTFVDVHSHHNSDDGFDFWKGGASAPIAENNKTMRIFYSSANLNGKNPFTLNGDGQGFKFGSGNEDQSERGKDRGTRFIYGSAACLNKVKGFDQNGTPMNIIAYNLSAQDNGGKNFKKVTNKNFSKDKFQITCNMLPRN